VELAAGDAGDARERTALATIREAGLRFHPLPLSRAGRNPLRELVAYRSLVALYRARRPDLVHHVTLKSVVYGTAAARRTGVPAVLNAVAGLGSVFLDDSASGRVLRETVLAVYRRAVRHPNMVMLFQNPDDAAAFRRLGLAPAATRATIRGSGVDLHQFAPSPEPTGAPVVLLPARLLRDKGVFEFVAAAERLRAAGSSARFVLVGDIDDNPSAVPRSILEAWARAGVVECWGYRSDMPAVLAEATIVCLPSYREGMPKALLEAAACGRPIVTSDVPGCRDCVTPDTGILVPAKDFAALADALAALLADQPRRAAMAVAARDLAVREFGVSAVIASTLALYRKLLLATGRPSPLAQ